MSDTYIGLTIGPIFDTLSLAFTPAALWAGSYLFSSLTRTICELLVSDYYSIPMENIVSPYYDPEEELLNRKDGVGLFHDRVIFRVDESHPFDIKQLENLRSEALWKISEEFTIANDYLDTKTMYDYLNEYIMVSGCRYTDTNAILGSAKRLDSLELAKPFVQQEEINALFAIFVNEGSENTNRRIRELPAVRKLEHWQLLNKDGSIRSLPDIASNGVPTEKQQKKHNYYAIVRSDGDRMGKILEKLNSDDEIRQYSRTCLQFCSKIAETVSLYGGITIYSGGDDLLAILPLESKSSSEIPDLFSFLKKAGEIFKDSFKGLFEALNAANKTDTVNKMKIFDLENDLPTLSFGVSVYYNKFPLYEALQDSQYLLFGVAKDRSSDADRHDCTAIRFQKHAGQSEGLLIQNEALNELIALKEIIDRGVTDDNGSTVILSALHKLSAFDRFYMAAQDETSVTNLFNNFFDADSQSRNSFLKKELPKHFNKLRTSAKIDLLPDYRREYLREKGLPEDNKDPLPVPVLCYLLRIFKLYKERIGEKT